jgi:hypothetical protein
MKKGFILSLVMLFAASVSAARFGNPRATQWRLMIDSATISGTASSSSTAVNIGDYENFGYKIVIRGGVAADVKLEYEVIESTAVLKGKVEEDGYNERTPEWTTPTSNGELVSSITSGSQADSFAPMVTKWLHLKVTGNASNTTACVDVYLSTYGER